MKQKILDEINSHFRLFGRAISAAELEDAVQTRAGFDWSLQGFKDAIDQLLKENKIEISGSKMYGAVVNEGSLPTAGEITPHPAKNVQTKDVSMKQGKNNNAINQEVGGGK